MGKADLHIHSDVSDGMASVPEIMAHAEERTDLDLIAIADHDAVRGSLEAMEWVRKRAGCRIRALFATEITSDRGRHLLAYFLTPPYPTEPFPRLRSYRRTVGLIHEMGGLAVIPHPTVVWTPSSGYRHIRSLLHGGAPLGGLEVCNAAPGARGIEAKLRLFNRRDFHLAELGGSDAHHLSQIGSAYTAFEGCTPADLQLALSRGATSACWGEPASVTWREHARQVFKSWVEKPTRGLRSALAIR